MGSIHPTDFIIYDFNKKRLQFEGLFQRPPIRFSFFYLSLVQVNHGKGTIVLGLLREELVHGFK